MQTRVALLIAVLLPACSGSQPPASQPAGIANPASVYCAEQGGKLELREGPGGTSGYCHLPDGRVVEEWELYRAAHPAR